jgi:peptidoglycan/LPS O-acetylase OafA/YrhL
VIPGGADYRDDINGLRAVAVLGVLLFHLDLAWFPGGFLGVDVFFVISGFLITRLILRGLGAGEFSFSTFYYNRARRLLPAALVTIAGALVAGVLIFPPLHLLELGQSAVYAVPWLSNFYFWHDTDYFSSEAITKPLLHMWSLSVEEQFYLFWPFFLFAAFRWKGAAGVLWVIAGLFAMGLAATEWATRAAPAAAFFLTPFRVFEFAIGGLVVFSARRLRPTGFPAEILIGAALATLAVSFVLVTERAPFPTLSALIVCCASAVIIHSGPTRLAAGVLANPVSTFVGRISYSLYLVHWPVVVFYRYAVFRDITPEEKAALFAVMIVLGAILHQGVEQRFRRYDFFGKTRPQLLARRGWAVATFAIVALAATAWAQKGWTWRSAQYYPPGVIKQNFKHRYQDLSFACQLRSPGKCPKAADNGAMTVLVVGDSHAPDGFNMIRPALGTARFVLDSAHACPPTDGVGLKVRVAPACRKANEERFDPDYVASFDVIVVSVLFNWYRPEDLRRYLDVIKRAAPSKKVIVFGNYVVLDKLCWEIAERFGAGECINGPYIKSRFLYERELKDLVADYGYLYVSKKDVLCGSDGATCPVFADGTSIPFTWDMHHLSYEFAVMIGNRIRDRVRTYVRDEPTPRLTAK